MPLWPAANAKNSTSDSEKLTPPFICCTMPLEAEIAYDVNLEARTEDQRDRA